MAAKNVNGIKVPGKSLALGRFLHLHSIDVCVSTKTHLRKEEVKGLALEGLEDFVIKSDCCRLIEDGRIRRGVAILVRMATAKCSKLPEIVMPADGLSVCSALTPLRDVNVGAIEIVGVYFRTSRLKQMARRK